MKKLIFILPLICLALSCTSMPTMPMGQGQSPANDQVHAENRIMKKNLDLALRENEVLKAENAQYKSHIKEQDCTISTLNADMESLTTKYNEDTANLNDEISELNNSYETLLDDFNLLEQESGRKISELTGQNAGLEKQLADETARLNNIIKDQKASFDAELASTKDAAAVAEKGLQQQITELSKAAVEKDETIKSLEAHQQTALEKTAALEKSVQEQAEKIRQMEKAHQELTTSHQGLQKTIEEKQAVIEKLSQKPEPSPIAPQPAPQPVKQTH